MTRVAYRVRSTTIRQCWRSRAGIGPPPVTLTYHLPVIRLVIVDDQALVREGLALILGGQPDIEVVAELADGAALLAAAVPADIILLDLYLPGADRVATMRELRSRQP